MLPYAVGNRKRCSSCRRVKSVDRFSRNVAMKDGRANECKRCMQARLTIWRRKRFGYPPGLFEKMVEDQKGQCPICLEYPEELVPDHDHKTGKHRAPVCRKCNCTLGLVKDSPTILQNAEAYLERWREN